MAEKAARTRKTANGTQKRQTNGRSHVETPPTGKALFPLVAVGASAGGLEAFEQLFKNLPPTTHAAFVVISHLDPKHTSMMTELISRFTRMAVREAADDVEVEPDHVYVIPPNKDLSIFHGRLQLTEQDKSASPRMPIDFFLRSLAEDSGDRAVVVILSGTGSDGTLGLRAVQGAGGTVFAQDPIDARYDGMPRSAIRTGLVDYVLPVEEIARQLMVLLERYSTKKESTPDEETSTAMQKILMVRQVEDGARLLALQKKHRHPPHPAADKCPQHREPRCLPALSAGAPRRGAAALQGAAHQRDQLLPGAGSLRGPQNSDPPGAFSR